MLAVIGMEAFAERARRELIATCEKVRRRSAETRDPLTQQEQIARLARDGRTNPEIGAQLFLSARTVEWHLGKIFAKLGIGSRRELHAALASLGRPGQRPSREGLRGRRSGPSRRGGARRWAWTADPGTGQ
jgi:DNA-binding CsgD family transcriptional regulator